MSFFEHIRISRQSIFVLWVCFTAVLIRGILVYHADMPTGDEVNTYIWHAQTLVRSGSIPPLYEHPLVAICYAPIIGMLRLLNFCLAGVRASFFCFMALGVIGALGAYWGLSYHLGFRFGLIGALLYGCNPAIALYPPRGDVSLFSAIVPWCIYLCERGVKERKWFLSLSGGCLGSLLWLSRSDGMSFFLALLLVVGLLYWKSWRNILWIILGATVIMGGYQTIYRLQSGHWSEPPSQRAWDAFYQAEGLHDQRGGSWQDFTRRGKERFGSSQQYDESFVRMLWVNRGAVVDRVRANIPLIIDYHSVSYGFPFWITIIVAGGVVTSRAFVKVAFIWIVPFLLASFPVFMFYMQRSYFVMFSGGGCIAFVLGLRAWNQKTIDYLNSQNLGSGNRKLYAIAEVLLPLLLFSFIICRILLAIPDEDSRLARKRLMPVLCALEKRVRPTGLPYISPKIGGSHAVEIYTDSPARGGSYGLLKPEPDKEITINKLRSRNIRYLLSLQERPNSWFFSCDQLSVVFVNKYGNVMLKRFDWRGDQGEERFE